MLYLAEQIAWLLALSLAIGIAVGWFTASREGDGGDRS